MTITMSKTILHAAAALVVFTVPLALAQDSQQGSDSSAAGASATQSSATSSSANRWGPKRSGGVDNKAQQTTQQSDQRDVAQQGAQQGDSTAATWGPKREMRLSTVPRNPMTGKARLPEGTQEKPGANQTLSNRGAPSPGKRSETGTKKAETTGPSSGSKGPATGPVSGPVSTPSRKSSRKTSAAKTPTNAMGQGNRKHGKTEKNEKGTRRNHTFGAHKRGSKASRGLERKH
jgi:hypothetical protein